MSKRQLKTRQALRAAIDAAYLTDEETLLIELAAECKIVDYPAARELALQQLKNSQTAKNSPLLNQFLNEFSLSSSEGVALMCLAEALLRIPDTATQARLICDKLGSANWQSHLGRSPSLLVNAASWALLLSGKTVSTGYTQQFKDGHYLRALLSRLGEPLVRKAVQYAMSILAAQFVIAESLPKAVEAANKQADASLYSFDMLGEAAITAAESDQYFERYRTALLQLGDIKALSPQPLKHSISIKLSALHPRFEYAQSRRVKAELIPKLLELARLAKQFDIELTIDAEEASRLELTLDCFEAVFSDVSLKSWHGLGLAVQAYQKRATAVLRWLQFLAASECKVIPVRLVKGAYWDSEIKLAQSAGLKQYPVFTRKQATDTSYLACARFLLANSDTLLAQFASHNALTLASVHQLATPPQAYELQRLFGMAENLPQMYHGSTCRIYAPIGLHDDLLPYLIRRMLENGANSSFVYQAGNPRVSHDKLLEDPLAEITAVNFSPHPKIVLPGVIYPGRKNSEGLNFNSPSELARCQNLLKDAANMTYLGEPITYQPQDHQQGVTKTSPADKHKVIGQVFNTNPTSIPAIIDSAVSAQIAWTQTSVEHRATILENAAELFEENQYSLIHLCIEEAGRCLQDAQAEVREAIDFCRYYAQQARLIFSTRQNFHSIAGERNQGYWQGRGVFLCISPWNFPVAIFTGQIVAALLAGNSVIAKPSSASVLCGAQVIKYLHQAGVPKGVLQFTPGSSESIGSQLCSNPHISGLAFTGSIDTVQKINRQLAARNAPIACIIAETGGQNVMIADSSTLAEQLVKDVIHSAFNSAGQRCSALRVLFIAEEIADNSISLIKGAMQQLSIGQPAELASDIGPLINQQACQKLQKHISYLRTSGAEIFQLPLPEQTTNGSYFPPTLCELADISLLNDEVFGPVLHVIRYQHTNLPQLIESINNMGYGLTLGIHSRIQSTINNIYQHAKVGNIYINRDMVAAVVGAQPFGGCGLSGTGPKAGGPNYLARFACEVTQSINTSAIGGNASLLMLDQ